MTSERVQRRIERLLDQIEVAADGRDWSQVRLLADDILRLDPDNIDAKSFLAAAGRLTGVSQAAEPQAQQLAQPLPTAQPASAPQSFANGRYVVKRFLGEGGKKKVYLATDSLLDRDVAFALIKTEGLDAASRERIKREAQAMGRLGAHPHIVTVFDIGEENDQPYLVLPVLGGGDVEGIIEKAPDHKLPLAVALKIAIETCLGLEFVHGKGIIHRDLKPGNVWLTDDGRAMIGDFGLAVAMDRSRLTQAGMMVGTVSYMPPEQAMGGEITPRSDLYALGAMLYEMICGRPPFIGSETVAIIGQHLNTQAVAPTWLRPECPPSLESLILRLLEKDPSKRPESATLVREALQAIAQSNNLTDGRVPAEPPPPDIFSNAAKSSNDRDPLYRRAFVGRENELRQLQSAFDGAISGNGGMVMLVGEPGIGKTALSEHLIAYTGLRGGKALVGHCFEDGGLALPYMPFIEAIRAYVLSRDPEGLRSDLGTGAADVARIVSEIRDRVRGIEVRLESDPEDERWRLLQSVSSFLRAAATVQPMLIVLEDLHWADHGTLEMLLHLSRNLAGSRLLIVGTYRDVEVDRSHPLSGALADISRVANFLRIALRGLSSDQIRTLYEEALGNRISAAQAAVIERRTEGNPLFVQEVLRNVIEQGPSATVDSVQVVPATLRDIVGQRLSRLSEPTVQVLSVASVLGKQFRLDALQKVCDVSEDAIIDALEEATRNSVLDEIPRTGVIEYRFAHSFLRQTLYNEIFAPRRIRWHQQSARVLEEIHSRRLPEHAAELSEQFSYSSDATDLEKAIRYGRMAAERATSLHAFDEAVTLLERCVEVQQILDHEDAAKRCDLLLELASALASAGNPKRVLDEVAPEALTLAERIHDRRRASQVAQLALNALRFQSGGGRIWTTATATQWSDKADELANAGTLDRVWADIAVSASRPAEAGDRLARSLTLARTLNDNSAVWAAGSNFIWWNRGPETFANRVSIADELIARPREGVNHAILCHGLYIVVQTLWSVGRLTEAAPLIEETRLLAQRTKQPNLEIDALCMDLSVALMRGQLDQALEFSLQIAIRSEETQLQEYGWGPSFGPIVRLACYIGVSQLPPPVSAFLASAPGAYRVLAPALVSFVDQDEPGLRSTLEQPTFLSDTPFMLDLAVSAQATGFVAEKLPIIDALPYLTTGINFPSCIRRVVADAAAMVGDKEKAQTNYDQALEISIGLGWRPEAALSRLGLAELLMEGPEEHDKGIEYLDAAIAEFQALKMQPALERALRHRGLLKA